MQASDAYTSALKKVVKPSTAAYPASRLTKLLAGDRPHHVQPASGAQPGTGRGWIARTTMGLVTGGALAVAVLLRFAVRRHRRVAARPSAA